jgi:hypothetical protein
MPNERPIKPLSNDALNEEDNRILGHWRDSLSVQDPRYHSKGLLQLATHAMIDEEFRSRLVNDTEALFRELQPKLEELPEGVALRFFDNTNDTLNVILPPQAGEVSHRSAALKDLLRSRTSVELISGGDDWDFGNFTDSGPAPGHADGGDPDSVDGPIFVVEP